MVIVVPQFVDEFEIRLGGLQRGGRQKENSQNGDGQSVAAS